MKKLVGFAAGSAAALSMALVSAGQAGSAGPLDVTGQTFAQAVAILKQQGYMATFGGSVGSDVPEGQCIVTSQKVMPGPWPTNVEVSLMLNCTKAAQPPPQPKQPAGAPGVVPGAPNPNAGPPHVGANGVTTVTATPVAPPPPGG